MRIDIWSDVVCPWCAIGNKRLQSALADFAHADEVEVVYHSFQLDPSAPSEPTERATQMLARKYRMSPSQAAEAQGRVSALAAEEGMDWTRGESWHVGTRDAHRLLHLALTEHGATTQVALKEALWQAHFGDVRNIGDAEVLTDVAVSVGLDAVRVREVLDSSEFAEAVDADIDRAADLGASGVPFFVVDHKFAISGAQPAELFGQALERAWAERTPLQTLTAEKGETGDHAGHGAGACGPDGCPI